MDLNNNDISEAVRNSAMLVDVTISVWRAERSDAALMEEIKANAGATGNVGRVVKNMLAGADGLLKDATSAFAAIRSTHYGQTLPWVSNPHAERQRGPRLLPTMLWDRYTTSVAQARRKAYLARDVFVEAYPNLVVQARDNLRALADVNYPTAEEVGAAFKVFVDFEPIPAGASFKGLPDMVVSKLASNLQARQTRMIETANAAMWEEVRDRVKHMAERLADPAAKFKATTVETVRELVTLLPGWNITGDVRAAEVVRDIEDMLHGVRADDFRNDARVRADAANQARAVTDKLSQWGL